MTPADRKPFLEVIMGFAELKGKQLSAPAIELYWRAMQRWTLDEFKAAAEELLRICEFMPMPKNFEDLRKKGRLTCGEAWAQVLSIARGHTRGQLPELTQRALNAIGGIYAVAMSDVDKTPFLERRFAEHYASIQDAEDVREAVPQIAGNSNRRLNGPTSARNLLPRAMGGKS